MKKRLLFGALLAGSVFSANAQTVLFQDSFETYDDFIIENIGPWTLIDVDMAPTYTVQQGTPPVEVVYENAGYVGSFMVLNPSQAQPAFNAAWAPHTGNKVAACFDAVVNPLSTDPQGPNNDWLITPQVTLGTTGNTVTFWAKSITAQYGLERFKVGVSTTGTDVDNFTVISPGTFVAAPIEWTQYTYNLDAYAGQNVRISINCVSSDAFAFLVDDVSISTTSVAGVNDQLASQFAVFPNPATNVINVSNNNNILVDGIQIVDLNGRTVKSVKFDGVASAEVNISDLSSGMYMMTVSSDKGTMTKKIVKN
ncbi:MAG: T9SS type A sorting domain-containing protein [Flavobacterium sp.]|nr:MAG: T9SS type A sorting domain-containing protein [Flavobacterium sp.]